MRRHLSSQQISEWALGERAPELERHVDTCPACRAEVSDFHNALTVFRNSVRHWSDQQIGAFPHIHPQADRPRSWITFHKLSWASAVAMICILAGLSVRQRIDQQRVADAATTDAVLLQQVDMELSRAVPRPMEPLAKLVLWDGTTTPEIGGPGRARNHFGNQP